MAIPFIDLCSGIGGFHSGLVNTGHYRCVGHAEIDKNAEKAYNAIYGEEGGLNYGDLRTINPRELPHFDLLCGGFPCQSFSVAGRRLGFRDTRGTVFFEIARILAEKRPPFLLLENVLGLLSHDSGRTLNTIFSALVEMGYNLEWMVLNSKYFGVPQQRRRLYIVGYLDPRCAGKVFPFSGGNAKNLKQLIPGPQGQRVYETDGIACTQCAGSGGWGGKTGLYFIDMNADPVITDVARCITARQDSGVSNHRGEHSAVLIEDAPRAILTPDRETVRQQGRRMKEPNEAMFTITAQDKHGIYHKGRIRKLMPIECWRLQGFTDEQFMQGFREVCNYITAFGIFTNYRTLVFSKSWFDGLEPEAQEAIRQASKAAQDYCKEEQASNERSKQLEMLEEAGCTVTYYTDEERQAFVDQCKDIWPEFREMIGPEIFDQVEEAMYGN